MFIVPGKEVGLGQAKRLCKMPHDKRLEFIATGLPVILASAQSLWRASLRLGNEIPREAGVLKGIAVEESAKILILIDVVRCPKRCVSSRIGAIMGWFYRHLARLIYAESVLFPRVTVQELQEHVDLHRKDFRSKEIAGETIHPNQHLYHRERLLYADVNAAESDELSWNDPLEIIRTTNPAATEEGLPLSLLLVEAMEKLGIFSLQGLKAMSEVWDRVEFAGPEGHSDAVELVQELVDRLAQEDLAKEDSVGPHLQTLLEYWRLPMYNLDFKSISNPK